MATVIPNDFTSFQLNEDEQLEGARLTVTQKQVIQNYLAVNATEKIHLEYDPEHPLLYAQQEAYKKGQIDTYRFLLDASDAAEEALAPTSPNQ